MRPNEVPVTELLLQLSIAFVLSGTLLGLR